MTFRYVPATDDEMIEDKPTAVVLSDGEYMLYQMLQNLISTLKKKKG